MTETLKLLYILFLRAIRHVFCVLPIHSNRVIFESFSGENYGCNPKYISEALAARYGNKVEIIWALRDSKLAPEGVITCKYRSFQHLIYRITSRVYVCNFLQAAEFPKRKGQIEIQTWHGGGCYKKVGTEEADLPRAYSLRRDMHVAETDYFIACSKFTEDVVITQQLGYRGPILRTGMPRNDLLFTPVDPVKKAALRRKAGIDPNSFVVLYAPTWRKNMESYAPLDYSRIKQAFELRFGKPCSIYFRAHLYGKDGPQDVCDLTAYPDMQELLYCCDALITDYSSCMWDFCLTEKPCFLYTPDLTFFTEQRGFDRDIYTWGFPVCKTNDAVCDAILTYNDHAFREKMKKHKADLGSYESGTACDELVKFIGNLCNCS